MSLKPMPFLSGRVPSSSELHGRHDSPSDIVSVISLPKVQQALWLDYLVRPYACHYYLRLEVDLTSLSPTLERLLEVKIPLAHLLQNNATFAEAGKAFGKNLSNVKKHEMYPFLSLIEEARKQMNESQLKSKLAVTFSPKLANKHARSTRLRAELLS
ncbi:hypothetical protein PtrEW4_011977, partial [Pyrenophora tritici-repentis]